MAKKRTKSQRKEDKRKRDQKRADQKANSPSDPKPAADAQVQETEPNTTPRVVDEMKPQANDASAKNQPEQKGPNWWRRINWDLVFSACLVAFTLGTVIVGYCQWEAMKAQNTEMLEARKEMAKQTDALIETNRIDNQQLTEMRLDKRAWISMAYPKMNVFAPGEPILAQVTYRNAGPTPGSITCNKHDFFCTEDMRKVEAQIDEFDRSPDVGVVQTPMAPGITMTHRMDDDVELTQEMFDAIKGFETQLAVVCVIAYDDFMGNHRRSRWVFIYEPEREPEGKWTTYAEYGYMK